MSDEDELVRLCNIGVSALLRTCLSRDAAMKLVKDDPKLRLQVYHQKIAGSPADRFKAVIELVGVCF